jgi:hypothetical protein
MKNKRLVSTLSSKGGDASRICLLCNSPSSDDVGARIMKQLKINAQHTNQNLEFFGYGGYFGLFFDLIESS